MKINNKTNVFISVASFPGNTGALLHNLGYKISKLNCVYIPFKCDDLTQLKNILNVEKFRGISVSMPFKSSIIKYLDKIDKTSKTINAVNTILRKGNKLYGYNTDYLAIKKIIERIKFNIFTSIILGNGATSKTTYEVLKNLKVKKIILCARDISKFKNWKLRKSDIIISWDKRHKIKVDLLINCTPVGMIFNNNLPIAIFKNKQPKHIIDFPVNKKTKLKLLSKRLKIPYTGGLEISLIQGIEQFKIYTGKKLNINKIKKILNYNFDV